jgi:sigma-B regulation protein RsbU (phosphoserine phosphatase)
MPSRKIKARKKKILVVDDNRMTLKMLEKILSKSGYAVLPASNGSDAVTIAKEKRPDLLLLDIALPDIDGIQVACSLKDDPRTESIPVIFLSSLLEEEIREKTTACPGGRFLRKPLNAEELLKEIGQHI